MSTQPDFKLLAAALRFADALREAEAAGLLAADDLRADVCAELDSPDAFIDRVDTLLATVDAARCDVDQEFDASGLPREDA